MTENKEQKREKRLLRKLRNLLIKWRYFKERMPIAGKFIIAMLLLIIVSGSGVVAYSTYDFTQNNPDFCNQCHIMNQSFKAWQKSEHADINCHDCHKLAVTELNAILVSALIKRTEKVPVRYDKVIVPWKTCISCHWENNDEHPNARKINTSKMHAKHYFMEKIECSKCHGYKLHKFLPDEKFCLRCHQHADLGRNKKMTKLACLNCHTDRTADLKPGRGKCLFCHGEDPVRRELIDEGTIDVTHFQPSEKTLAIATKITTTSDSPMQFSCNKCHNPHEQIRPNYETCISCHAQQLNVGMHGPHITNSELVCIDCHQSHSWRITKEEAKTICTDCHDYIEPVAFLSRPSM